MNIEFEIKIKIYLIVPIDFSKEMASLIQTTKPISMFIIFVVINDVVISLQNW